MANVIADLKDTKRSGSTSVVFRILGIQRISNASASDSEVHCSPRQHNSKVPIDLIVATRSLNEALVALNKCAADAKCTSAALEGSKKCFKECYDAWSKQRVSFHSRVQSFVDAFMKAKGGRDITSAIVSLKELQSFTPYFLSGQIEIGCSDLCDIKSILSAQISDIADMILEISKNGCDPRVRPIILKEEVCGKDWKEGNIVTNEPSWVNLWLELARLNVKDRLRGVSPTASPRSAGAGSRSGSEDESGSDSDSNSNSRPQSADSKVHAKT